MVKRELRYWNRLFLFFFLTPWEVTRNIIFFIKQNKKIPNPW